MSQLLCRLLMTHLKNDSFLQLRHKLAANRNKQCRPPRKSPPECRTNIDRRPGPDRAEADRRPRSRAGRRKTLFRSGPESDRNFRRSCSVN